MWVEQKDRESELVMHLSLLPLILSLYGVRVICMYICICMTHEMTFACYFMFSQETPKKKQTAKERFDAKWVWM